jgi:hypothetical protein
MGWFVENRGWKVAYTRKVIHVAFFAVPFWFDAHMVSLFLYIYVWAIRLIHSCFVYSLYRKSTPSCGRCGT